MRHMRHAQTADSFTGVADLRVAVDGQTPTRPCRCVRAPGGSDDTANALRGLERLTRELRQVNCYRLFSGALLVLSHGYCLWHGQEFVIILLRTISRKRIANIHQYVISSAMLNGS